MLPLVASGQLVALGGGGTGARSMPNIPTLREAGVANFSAGSWLALFAPRGTPAGRIARLNAELGKVMALPEAQKVLWAAGLEPATNSPSEMRGIMEADYRKWGRFHQDHGSQAQIDPALKMRDRAETGYVAAMAAPAPAP